MDNAERGDIKDYEVTDSDGNVTDTLPMLVLHVNDQEGGDGTVVGLVFQIDGRTNVVTIPKEDAPEPPPNVTAENRTEADFDSLSPEDRSAFFRAELGKLTDADRQSLRDALGSGNPEPSPSPEPITAPTEAPSVPANDGNSPTSETGTGGLPPGADSA